MKNVAWIGLGRMGLPMANHLVQAGHSVKGHDLLTDSPSDLASDVEWSAIERRID